MPGMGEAKGRIGGVLAWMALSAAVGMALSGLVMWGYTGWSAGDVPDRTSGPDLSAEESALGLSRVDRQPEATGKPKHRRFGKRLLHGKLVVADKKGRPRVLMVQRGEIIKLDSDGLTVESKDKFTLRWTFPRAGRGRVFENDEWVERDALDVGDKVSVAGRAMRIDGQYARLIVIDG